MLLKNHENEHLPGIEPGLPGWQFDGDAITLTHLLQILLCICSKFCADLISKATRFEFYRHFNFKSCIFTLESLEILSIYILPSSKNFRPPSLLIMTIVQRAQYLQNFL